MRYLAAYLLAVLAEKEPTAQTIKEILQKSDVSVDEGKLQALLDKLEGKSLEEVIAEGKKKLQTAGGVAAAAPSTGSGSSGSAPSGGVTEEAKPADEPEEDDGPMMNLFGDD